MTCHVVMQISIFSLPSPTKRGKTNISSILISAAANEEGGFQSAPKGVSGFSRGCIGLTTCVRFSN